MSGGPQNHIIIYLDSVYVILYVRQWLREKETQVFFAVFGIQGSTLVVSFTQIELQIGVKVQTFGSLNNAAVILGAKLVKAIS